MDEERLIVLAHFHLCKSPIFYKHEEIFGKTKKILKETIHYLFSHYIKDNNFLINLDVTTNDDNERIDIIIAFPDRLVKSDIDRIKKFEKELKEKINFFSVRIKFISYEEIE